MVPDVRGRTRTGPASTPSTPAHSRARVRVALLALALGGFAIGVTEFVALGLLPDLARELLPASWAASHADAEGTTGWLVSAYAGGVVVGAPTIAALGARLPRRTLLLGLLVAFTVTTLATALLPTFGLVLAARFAAGLPHGAYFGVATLAAAELLGPGNRGRAAASVLAGLTIANVVGVPLVTAVGQAAGWRAAYLVVAAAFAVTFVAVRAAVPHGGPSPSAGLRAELRAFTRPQVWLTAGIGAIGFGGLFSAYTYVAPITTEVTRLPAAAVPWVLVVFGVGMTIGNLAGGPFADRGVRRAMLVCFVGVLVALIVLGTLSSSVVGLLAGVLLVGAASAALSPAIQVRLMDVAKESTTIAAAGTHSALNIGNAIGAALGGVVVAAGLGYVAPIGVGIVLTIGGVVLAVVAFGLERRAAGPLPAHAPPAA